MTIQYFIHAIQDDGVIVLDFDKHRRINEHELEIAFKADSEEPVDIKLINKVDEFDFEERLEAWELALNLMLNDVRDSDSCTYKFFNELCKEESEIKTKIALFNLAAEAYMDRMKYCGWISNDLTKYVAFYGSENLNFGVYFPKGILYEKFGGHPMHIKVSDFSTEEILKYVIPGYYNELSAWDRDFLRKDEAEMKYLSQNWFNTIRLELG